MEKKQKIAMEKLKFVIAIALGIYCPGVIIRVQYSGRRWGLSGGITQGKNFPGWEYSGGNCPRWQLPGGQFSRGQLSGGNCPGGNFPGGNCPRTLYNMFCQDFSLNVIS